MATTPLSYAVSDVALKISEMDWNDGERLNPGKRKVFCCFRNAIPRPTTHCVLTWTTWRDPCSAAANTMAAQHMARARLKEWVFLTEADEYDLALHQI